MTEHGTGKSEREDVSGILPVLPRLPASILADMRDPRLPVSRRREASKRVFDQAHRVVAVVLGRSTPDVQDAAQDAFESIFEASAVRVAQVGLGADLASWVNTIAVRKAIDHRRRSSVRRHLSIEDVPTPPADVPWLDETVAIKHLVDGLLDLLTESERALVVLRYWNGQTDEDIAEALERPLGTVKTQLRRVLRLLTEHVHNMTAMQSYDIFLPPPNGTDGGD